ncbi:MULTISPECIES: extensin family protein [unclassified Rhizobium]|uniref:extensin-like domain-containing protein n=1 Tax=unclassified Rhizobium TaxID=2613769 RepID=UPI0017E390ED
MKKTAHIATAFLCLIMLTGAGLPETGPKPEVKPGDKQVEQQADDPANVDVAPKPQPKPETKPDVAEPDAASSNVPKPDTKPGENTSDGDKTARSSNTTSKDAAPPKREVQGPNLPDKQTLEAQHLTIEPESDADHSECVKELQALGVVFTDLSRIDDGNGCGIDKPIKVTEALPGIKLKPDGVFRCPVALALARWMKGTVIPAAAIAASDQGRITTINQASSYICRLRNSAETGKISEHARGNAVDIASFSFEKGEDIAVKPRREDSTLIGAFQRTVSAAGCLYFTTVLDPESDAAHETHFHLDVLERKGGYRYCH